MSSDDPRIEAGMRRQLQLRRERTDAGARPIGWKAGLNAPEPKRKLGLTRPLVGFLTDATLVPSPSRVTTWLCLAQTCCSAEGCAGGVEGGVH